MRGLNIHKYSPVSFTKLTPGPRVGFSSHLTADKLFPVNPRAITGPSKLSLLLEVKSMPALIIKQRLILVPHMNRLWLVHDVQPAGTDVRSKPQEDCQQEKCYARADPVLHQRLYSS